MVQRMGGEEF